MEEFTRLVKLMETLRGDEGCPWDKKQTEASFKTFLLEETYELIEAIEKGDYEALKEELGDVLFHIVFISQICREKGKFDIKDVARGAYEKMYGRHPHVFRKDGDDRPIEARWEEIKKAEKEDYSPVSHVPKILPALLRAYLISRRAAKTGFDWEKIDDIHEKLHEEIAELREAEDLGDADKIEEEVGVPPLHSRQYLTASRRRSGKRPQADHRQIPAKVCIYRRQPGFGKSRPCSNGCPLGSDQRKGEKGEVNPLLFDFFYI